MLNTINFIEGIHLFIRNQQIFIIILRKFSYSYKSVRLTQGKLLVQKIEGSTPKCYKCKHEKETKLVPIYIP